jgi:hypothetical protein
VLSPFAEHKDRDSRGTSGFYLITIHFALDERLTLVLVCSA